MGGNRRGRARTYLHLMITMLVGGLGNAHLNRSTELGQAVPQVAAGNRVNVRTAAGALVATGKF